jgi:hypothetical protein
MILPNSRSSSFSLVYPNVYPQQSPEGAPSPCTPEPTHNRSISRALTRSPAVRRSPQSPSLSSPHMRTNSVAPKIPAKRRHHETIESDSQTVLDPTYFLAEKKIDRDIAEYACKRAKYEAITATVTGEIEKLKQQGRLMEMQYQREREKEAHQLRLLHLQSANNHTTYYNRTTCDR